MHGNNRLGARRNLPGHILQIEIETNRAAIDEDRRGANPRDAARRGEKSEAGTNNLVARPDVQRHQRDQDRVGARAHTEGMLRAGELGQRALELLHLGPENK